MTSSLNGNPVPKTRSDAPLRQAPLRSTGPQVKPLIKGPVEAGEGRTGPAQAATTQANIIKGRDRRPSLLDKDRDYEVRNATLERSQEEEPPRSDPARSRQVPTKQAPTRAQLAEPKPGQVNVPARHAPQAPTRQAPQWDPTNRRARPPTDHDMLKALFSARSNIDVWDAASAQFATHKFDLKSMSTMDLAKLFVAVHKFEGLNVRDLPEGVMESLLSRVATMPHDVVTYLATQSRSLPSVVVEKLQKSLTSHMLPEMANVIIGAVALVNKKSASAVSEKIDDARMMYKTVHDMVSASPLDWSNPAHEAAFEQHVLRSIKFSHLPVDSMNIIYRGKLYVPRRGDEAARLDPDKNGVSVAFNREAKGKNAKDDRETSNLKFLHRVVNLNAKR